MPSYEEVRYHFNHHDPFARHMGIELLEVEPGRIGPLRGEARKIRSGRNLGTYDVRITDSDGTLVAIATVTGFMTKYPIQPKDA